MKDRFAAVARPGMGLMNDLSTLPAAARKATKKMDFLFLVAVTRLQ